MFRLKYEMSPPEGAQLKLFRFPFYDKVESGLESD